MTITADTTREETLLESLLELEADGYELNADGTAVVHGPYAALEALQDGLRGKGWEVREWSHQWSPLTDVSIHAPDTAQSCLKLLDALEELDDVRSVNTNLELALDLEID